MPSAWRYVTSMPSRLISRSPSAFTDASTSPTYIAWVLAEASVACHCLAAPRCCAELTFVHTAASGRGRVPTVHTADQQAAHYRTRDGRSCTGAAAHCARGHCNCIHRASTEALVLCRGPWSLKVYPRRQWSSGVRYRNIPELCPWPISACKISHKHLPHLQQPIKPGL